MQLLLSSKFSLRILLFFCFLCTSQLFSQEKDSLDQYDGKELSKKFNRSINYDTKLARIYADKLLIKSITNQDTLGIISAYNKFSSLENQLGDTKKAIEYIEKSIFIAKQDSKYISSEMFSVFKKGNILFYSGQYKKAFKNYTIVYDYYKKLKLESPQNTIALNIALIKSNLGDFETASELLLQCLDKYENTPKDRRKKNFSGYYKQSVILGITSNYVKYAIKNSNKKDSLLNIASHYNAIGLKESIEEKNKSYEINFMINEGIIKEERGHYKQALEKLNQANEELDNFKESSLLTTLYYHKGQNYKKLNQFDEAIEIFKKADSISTKNSSNYRMLQGAYYSLIEIYKKRGDIENQLKYQDKYIENERINKQISQEVRDDIHNSYALDMIDDKIAHIENSRLQAIITTGVLSCILIVFFIFYKKQKRKNKIAFEKLIQQLDAKKEEKNNIEKAPKTVSIDDEKVVQVLKALEKFEEKEWFRNKNCDLAFVAKKARTNKTYLSKIIHEHKQLKFLDYIRDLRIDYALERLKDDPVFRSYDIKSIAEESGFKSSDMFSRAFVKNTGIYPSYYIKNINKINT